MNDIFNECFATLDDPRVNRTRKHELLDIIAISLCAVITGAETWQEIEDFGVDHIEWLNTFLNLSYGIPSHDTFSRVFSALNPVRFQECTLLWLNRIHNLIPEGVIPIDGKTLRGSKATTKCRDALHIVNAWSCANSICLGQIQVDQKSNEITAVPKLLNMLNIEGAIVTLDAMGAQKETVKQIVEQQGDYVIALKGNQGKLNDAVRDLFTGYDLKKCSPDVITVHDEVNADHGRIEQRQIEVIAASTLNKVLDGEWSNLQSVARITYTYETNNKIKSEQRYYFSSIPSKNAESILTAIRAHWRVESMHWVMDVIFNEDRCRIREVNAAENYSWLRKLAYKLLKEESSITCKGLRTYALTM